jgi:hypothetical protein
MMQELANEPDIQLESLQQSLQPSQTQKQPWYRPKVVFVSLENTTAGGGSAIDADTATTGPSIPGGT